MRKFDHFNLLDGNLYILKYQENRELSLNKKTTKGSFASFGNTLN